VSSAKSAEVGIYGIPTGLHDHVLIAQKYLAKILFAFQPLIETCFSKSRIQDYLNGR